MTEARRLPNHHDRAPLFVYFGHPKCASRYIIDFISSLASLLGLMVKVEDLASKLPLDYHLRDAYPDRFAQALESIREDQYDFLCLGNAEAVLLEAISQRRYRGFHLVRDPRDILVSAYFSHFHSHPVEHIPWMREHRQRLQGLSDTEQGLLCQMDYLHYSFERMACWGYDNPLILETRFEYLIGDPSAAFGEILEFIGIRVPALGVIDTPLLALQAIRKRLLGATPAKRRTCPRPILRSLVHRHRFERKSEGRGRGEEDRASHYRKGGVGDWQEHFTPRIKSVFKERHGALLKLLAYERDDDW